MTDIYDAVVIVSDVLVIKALETVGKRIVRQNRSRFGRLGGRPVYLAHTLWQADDETVAKALLGAWNVLPHVVETWGDPCCTPTEALMNALDSYVHDLVVTQTAPTLADLGYRIGTVLRADCKPVPPSSMLVFKGD